MPMRELGMRSGIFASRSIDAEIADIRSIEPRCPKVRSRFAALLQERREGEFHASDRGNF